MSKPDLIKPALIGGATFGIASALPVLHYINCLCCVLVIAGGFVAALIASKEHEKSGAEFDAGRGALTGFLAGIFFAISVTFVGAAVTLMSGGVGHEISKSLDEIAAAGQEIPPEIAEFIHKVADMAADSPILITLGSVLVGLVFNFIVGSIFCTLGGLIGGMVFKVRPQQWAQQAPTAPPVPPAAPPMPMPPVPQAPRDDDPTAS